MFPFSRERNPVPARPGSPLQPFTGVVIYEDVPEWVTVPESARISRKVTVKAKAAPVPGSVTVLPVKQKPAAVTGVTAEPNHRFYRYCRLKYHIFRHINIFIAKNLPGIMVCASFYTVCVWCTPFYRKIPLNPSYKASYNGKGTPFKNCESGECQLSIRKAAAAEIKTEVPERKTVSASEQYTEDDNLNCARTFPPSPETISAVPNRVPSNAKKVTFP